MHQLIQQILACLKVGVSCLNMKFGGLVVLLDIQIKYAIRIIFMMCKNPCLAHRSDLSFSAMSRQGLLSLVRHGGLKWVTPLFFPILTILD